MKRLRIKREKEKKLIGKKTRYYVFFSIFVCCIIVAWNLHPNQNIDVNHQDIDVSHGTSSEKEMIYIFHDYEGNQYVLNNQGHGSASSWDYLFNEDVPDSIKGEEDEQFTNSVSLENFGNTNNNNEVEKEDINKGYDKIDNEKNDNEKIKNNQVSLDDMINELGIGNEDKSSLNNTENDTLVINLSELIGDDKSDETYYSINEYSDDAGSSLTIERLDGIDGDTSNKDNTENNNTDTTKDTSIQEDIWITAESFTFISEGWVTPILIPRDQLEFYKYYKPVGYFDSMGNIYSTNGGTPAGEQKKSGITILPDYEGCMTPRGYKIDHGDSVLAYEQMDSAPDICNIERRFCWKGKLSGTFTQQGCSINKNYTYNQRGEAEGKTSSKGGKKGGQTELESNERKTTTTQNPDGTVSVSKPLGTGSFVFDQPSQTSTNVYSGGDNIRQQDESVEQTELEHINCIAPWGERVLHGQFVQAFKHSNGFKDSPCEAQIRLCTMGFLLGSYSEPSCKTRDTSFIDWINGSPTWDTYSDEKIQWVKEQIESEKIYDKDYKRLTNSDELDRILRALDK